MIHYNQFRSQFPPRKGRNWNMRGVEIAYLASLQAAAKVVKAEIENTPEGRTGGLGLKGGECPFDVPSINKLSKWAGGGTEVRKSLSRRYEKLLDCEIRHLCDPPYWLIGSFRVKHFGPAALRPFVRGHRDSDSDEPA
jgi:hypothetical protein